MKIKEVSVKNVLLSIAVLSLLVCLAPTSRADWFDDFESYALGSGLHGQGGWEGWEGDPTWDAFVDDLYAHSPTQSMLSMPTTDIVQPFTGYTSGQWELGGWMYIPAGHTGQVYFIALNTYGVGVHNWSIQVRFEAGTVYNDGASAGTLPWMTDQWVEVMVEIDLDANTQTFWYGGSMLYTGTWTEEVSGGGAVAIGALDLFSNGGDMIYWDDTYLRPPGGTPVEPSSWGSIKSHFK
jgi:hypothetical protein